MPVLREERVYLSPHFSVSCQRATHDPKRDPERSFNLGALPLHAVVDYWARLPASWQENDGVFVPLLTGESIWLGFDALPQQPKAVQIEVGELNAISGSSRSDLQQQPQNYLVCPPQLHWDGVRDKDSIRPFSAEVLSISEGDFETLRMLVYEPLPNREFSGEQRNARGAEPLHELGQHPRREIATPILDPHGIGVWDRATRVVVEVHFLDASTYQRVTGKAAPLPRRQSEVYTGYRLP